VQKAVDVTVDTLDQLTGLHLGPAFRRALEAAVDALDTVTLAAIDTDKFKELNDLHGHTAGDELLRALGQRLQRLAGETRGFAGRIGGDEFAVALPGISLEHGFLQMERFRAEVTAVTGLVPSVPEYRLSISVGVANYPRDVRNASDLFSRADQALWSAKEAGRNQVVLPSVEEMVLKTNYYTSTQLARLKRLAESRKAKESVLLREALDDLLRKYDVK
jgi:diguanylate cyclase